MKAAVSASEVFEYLVRGTAFHVVLDGKDLNMDGPMPLRIEWSSGAAVGYVTSAEGAEGSPSVFGACNRTSGGPAVRP